jgi:hypothetical protein
MGRIITELDKETIAAALTPAWTPIQERNGYGLTGPRAFYDLALWYDVADNYVVPSGRRSTKTLITRRHLVRVLPRQKEYPDPRYAYCAPTRQQAKRLAWDQFKALIPSGWIKRIWETDLRIVTVFGSELWVIGLDKPQRIEGDPWDIVVVDETADLSKEDTVGIHIAPSMADRNGAIVQIGVPDYKGKNSGKYKEAWDKCIKWDDADDEEKGVPPKERGREAREAVKRAIKTGVRIPYLGISWDSEKVLTPTKIAYFMATMSKEEYDQEFRARWKNAPGLACPEFSVDKHVKPTNYLSSVPLFVACDFNYPFHNWFLGQVINRPETGALPIFRAFDQVFLRDSPVSKMILELQRKLVALNPDLFKLEWEEKDGAPAQRLRHPTAPGVIVFYGDYAGEARTSDSPYSVWQQIRWAFPDARFYYNPPENVAESLERLNGAILNAMGVARIEIDDRCKELIDDMKEVTRAQLLDSKEKRKVVRRTHAIDALRYTIDQFRKRVDRSGASANPTPNTSSRIAELKKRFN